MINVLEPQNALLKQFVHSFYVLKKSEGEFEFTAYPAVNTAIGLLRNATVTIEDECVYIKNSETPNHIAAAINQSSGSVHLHYLPLVDEIAINFKSLGFSSFTQSPPPKKVCLFNNWDTSLAELFLNVFATQNPALQCRFVEEFLLKQYLALPDEAVLLKALELLDDTSKDYKIEEVANLAGVHYKQLYRSFTEHVGCSPAHYRKLVKFRSSVISKMQKGNELRLVDVCYSHDYNDQPHFIKQFKELTGEKPSRFFKEVTSFGNSRVIFKID
jgi:AraC-like DNA-binding protein